MSARPLGLFSASQHRPSQALLAERAAWRQHVGPTGAAAGRRRHCRQCPPAAAAAASSSQQQPEECHFRTLGVPRTASREEIRLAYRRLARRWHPDVNASPEAAERFKAIARAFEVLSDEQQRRKYERARYGASSRRSSPSSSSSRSGRPHGRSSSGSGSSPGGAAEEQLPADVLAVLQVDFREAVLGAQRRTEVQVLSTCPPCGGSGSQPGAAAPPCPMCKGRRQIVKRQHVGGPAFEAVMACPICGGRGFQIVHPCSCCSGTGLSRQPRSILVRVPAGAEHGSRLRLRGEGDAARPGGPRGAVVLELRVRQEAGMWRRGLDLHSQLSVPLWDALLGGTASVATVRGSASLAIPPGTAHGQTLTLPAAGVQLEGGGAAARGAHHFQVKLEVPRQVSGAEQELLQRLAELQRRQSAGAGNCRRVG